MESAKEMQTIYASLQQAASDKEPKCTIYKWLQVACCVSTQHWSTGSSPELEILENGQIQGLDYSSVRLQCVWHEIKWKKKTCLFAFMIAFWLQLLGREDESFENFADRQYLLICSVRSLRN